LNVILLGPPGAGKGTQSKKIQERLKVPQISTGDMLRAARAAKTPLGLQAEGFMREGKLVPDELIIRLVEERLTQDDTQGGYILDGFPRTVAQAKALKESLKRKNGRIDRVVNIEVDEEELVRRLTGRRQCENCNQGYHLLFAPPKKEGICDRCGGKLFQRDDDKEETIRERLKVYKEMTEPLIAFYRNEGLLETVSGAGSVEQIFDSMIRVLEKKK